MDLRQLRYFVTIVEAGSFSRAAQVLRIAQPALSQHVRNMEMDLGVELLFRSPQGVRATEAGEILEHHARLILNQMEMARTAVKGGQDEPEGEVRFGMPGTVSQMLCAPLISEARRRYPKIKLNVAEAMSGFVLDWLREGKVDLGVLFCTVSDSNLQTRRILSENLALIGPGNDAGDPAEMTELLSGPVSFATVAKLTLILPGLGHGLRDLITERAEAEKTYLGTVIDIDTYGQIKLLVEGGLGYSILPVAAVQREVSEGRLRQWPIGEPVFSRDLHLARPCNRPLSNAERAIKELAIVTLTRLVCEGVWPATLIGMEEVVG